MIEETGSSRLVAKRTSRLVTMPTSSRLRFSTGTPEKLRSMVRRIRSRMEREESMVTGSRTTPLSKRFTARTSSACCSGVMFLCTMPMPPSWAIAIASLDSVTVSMAADIRGMLRVISRVRRVWSLTSFATTSDSPGTSSTSSKVSASSWTRSMATPQGLVH